MKPDLDSREHIATFLQKFYDKLLQDPVLAPIFLDQADKARRIAGHIASNMKTRIVQESFDTHCQH